MPYRHGMFIIVKQHLNARARGPIVAMVENDDASFSGRGGYVHAHNRSGGRVRSGKPGAQFCGDSTGAAANASQGRRPAKSPEQLQKRREAVLGGDVATGLRRRRHGRYHRTGPPWSQRPRDSALDEVGRHRLRVGRDRLHGGRQSRIRRCRPCRRIAEHDDHAQGRRCLSARTERRDEGSLRRSAADALPFATTGPVVRQANQIGGGS